MTRRLSGLKQMRFKETDSGNCRVYYTYGRRLYCFQDDRTWGDRPADFRLYECTRDGEPSHTVPTEGFGIDKYPPEGDSRTGDNFRAWAEQEDSAS
ncbi:hypothetical protein [Taklimakanibacter albus]|uniref:Uncharacterized protein n=1 Tax=Taklimakanibacter albus TaxID=2800327 RepID=A0ACC5RG59_9HYPH|nr:hypothetical protein [Aestuariivirga sp. YIM B02566]MBK1871590.1 hypothetical protein [Aestuariivirga sp. YIM B02566]